METFFTRELMWMLGIAGVGGIGLMTVTGRLVAKVRGSFQPYLKRSILYLLVFMLIAGLIGLSGFADIFKRPGLVYITIQLLCVLLGILHIRSMPRYLKWTGSRKTFWLEVMYTIVISAFGYMAFVLVFKWVNKDGYHWLMGSCIVWVLITRFIYHTFKKSIDIPVKIYSQWYYPLHEEMEDPDEEKMKHLILITFMFQKKTTDTFFTNFSAKAPVDMEFGQLFYYFINDYNDRYPNGKIQYVNERGEAFGWTFYRKPKWYEISTRYVDVEKTFFANRIRQNDVIVCIRS
jgi:hypothetical protein